MKDHLDFLTDLRRNNKAITNIVLLLCLTGEDVVSGVVLYTHPAEGGLGG